MAIAGYTIQRRIGSGGMAAVYLARQQTFDRLVAIKVLCDEQAGDKAYAERFLGEAKTVASLNHPHIIPVYDVGHAGEHSYIAMEYLPGNTLCHWIKTGLLEQEAVKILCQIADALDYAHSKGVIHRDIKPDNIMFRENGSAVLTDFGIARSGRQDTDLTREGLMIGTPRYMSPEQARGHKVDARSDVYSLGAVFYEMLTGRPPYQADNPMAMALAHVNEPVPVLPDAYGRYQRLLDNMMAKDVQLRYTSCRSVIKAMDALSGQMAGAPKQAGLPAGSRESPAKTAEQHDSVATAADTLAMPGKPLNCETVLRRKAFVFRQSVIKADIVAEDAGQFAIRFGRVSEQLLPWREKFGRKASRLELQVFTRPTLQGAVETAVRRLYQTRPLYAFMDKIVVVLTICDLQGRVLAHYPAYRPT